MTEWADGETLEKRGLDGDMGGTMRLGAFEAYLKEDSRVAEIYGTRVISERHRHRYEVIWVIAKCWKIRGWFSPACRPMACCRRLSKYPSIRGILACSFIRN